MSDLDSISRQAMQDLLDRVSAMHPYRQIGNRESYSTYNEAWTDAINMVDAELNSLPPAQPEIIRCGECKYRRNQSETTVWLPCRALIVPDDFSCIRAERREG